MRGGSEWKGRWGGVWRSRGRGNHSQDLLSEKIYISNKMERMTLSNVSWEYTVMIPPDSWGWLRCAAPQISAPQRGRLSFQIAYELPFFLPPMIQRFLVHVLLCFYSLTFWRHSSDYSSGYNVLVTVLMGEGERTHPCEFEGIVFCLPGNHLTLHFLTFVLIIWEFHTMYLNDFTILLKSSNASVTWLTLWYMSCTWEKVLVIALVKFKTWQLEFSTLSEKIATKGRIVLFPRTFSISCFQSSLLSLTMFINPDSKTLWWKVSRVCTCHFKLTAGEVDREDWD